MCKMALEVKQTLARFKRARDLRRKEMLKKNYSLINHKGISVSIGFLELMEANPEDNSRY